MSLYATGAQISRAHLLLCARHRGQAEVIAALNAAKKALSAEGDLEKGRRLSEMNRDREAVPFLRRAALRSPNADAQLWLGIALYALGRHEEASWYLQRAVDSRGGYEDRLWLGRALCRLEKYADAIEVLRRASGGPAQKNCVLCWLGAALFDAGRVEEGLPHLRYGAQRCGRCPVPAVRLRGAQS